MPTYTMINKTTGEEKDMFLSFAERELILSEGEWSQQLSTPKSVTNVTGTLKQAGDGWKEVLSRVKSVSTGSNTINE